MNLPTTLHSQAAEAVVEFFSLRSGANAILLVNSCARGKAVRESDLDIAILVESPTTSSANRQLEQDGKSIMQPALSSGN